jgi:Tfp pilus assembly protein PilW
MKSGIADRIRAANSARIREVDDIPENFSGHIEELIIYLVPDATDAQVVDAWCNVITPAGIDQMPVAHIRLHLAGTTESSDAALISHCSPLPIRKLHRCNHLLP